MKIDVKQLEFMDRTLRDILLWIEEETGAEFVITSLYRIGDSGVHGTLPLRGTDLRCRDSAVGEEIESLINKTWLYDPNRSSKMCAKLHGEGFNLHLHVQAHPNTRRR